jgi:hypothetical protein
MTEPLVQEEETALHKLSHQRIQFTDSILFGQTDLLSVQSRGPLSLAEIVCRANLMGSLRERSEKLPSLESLRLGDVVFSSCLPFKSPR